MTFRCDLHIHSCLSPCGDLTMSPKRIVEEALRHNLDIVALTDHNSALNCPAFFSLATQSGILPICGLEITSREEVHILALFETPSQALSLGEWIYEALAPLSFDPEKYGDQVYVDTDEVILGAVDRYLGQACEYSLEEIIHAIHNHEGLAIPSHIDRPGSGLLDNLGFLLPPEETGFDAIELSKSYWLSPYPLPNQHKYACLASSDAHYPDAIGCLFTLCEMEEKSWKAFAKALKNKNLHIPPLV
ncbi:MAG: PHP domain-containing protein [Brevinematales bacterium]|nr:PHP domain-containing protein [Brevinematales bacterium]